MKVSDLFEAGKKMGNDMFDRYALHNLANPSSKSVKKVDKIKDLAEILKVQCSDILKAYERAEDPLYRGIRDAEGSDQVIITGIRQDRRPIEMKSDWHEILHDAFLKAGLKATRRNSIFCTTSKRIAEEWGNVYVIFPKNGWSATVFTEYKDDYTFYHLSAMSHLNSNIKSAKSREEKIDYIVDELEEMGKLNITTPNDLAKIISNQYEDILLTGSSYIAIKHNSPILTKLSELLNIHL